MSRQTERGLRCGASSWVAIGGMLLAALLFCEALYSQTKSYEEIYQQVFKKTFVKELQSYDVNFIANGKFLGRISLQAPATGPIEKIAQTPFVDMVRGALNDAAYAELLRLVDAEGFIPEQALATRGYVLTLYRSKGYMVMTVPRDKRNAFVYIDLQGGYWAPDKALSPPANTLSGYVNLQAALYQSETDQGRTDTPASVDLESVVNMNGLVLRQVGNLESDSATPYALSAIQGVHDSADFTRYVVGDVDFPARGFQGVPRVFGVGVGKLYYRNRQLLDSDNQSTRVTIAKQGTMKLRLNGLDLRQLPVEEGIYVLENIPTRIGVNKLEMVLTYADGSAETRVETFVRDTDLVGVGQSEFYYAAGVYSDDTGRQYHVQGDRPVASLYHLYRPHPFWLQGVYGQIDQDQRLWGLDTYFPTTWGVFRLDTAQYAADRSALGGLVEYKTYYDPGAFIGTTRVVFAGYQSGFRKFGDGVDTDVKMSFSGDTNLNVSTDTFVNLRAFAERYRSRSGTYYGGGGYFSSQWEGLRTSLGGNYARSTAGISDYSVFSDAYLKFNSEWTSILQLRWRNPVSVSDMSLSFYLTWAPGDGRHAFTGSYQGSDRSQEARYSYSDALGTVGNLSARFIDGGMQQTTLGFGQRNVYSDFQVDSNFSDLTQTEEMTHTLRYGNTRGLLDVRYTESQAKDSDSFLRQTQYRLATGLAFVDGQMAFGRPIRDNFVLVYPEETLSGRAFVVGNNGLVDMFGPAVLTDFPAWSESNVAIGDIPDLPEGYDLGALRHKVSLGYYGGQAIRVGKGMRTRVFGTAQTAKGPLAYVACDVFLEKTPDQVVTRVLTGPDGGFLIQGLEPGSYGFRLQAFTNDVIYFEIEDSKSVRSYDMGVVVLKHLDEE